MTTEKPGAIYAAIQAVMKDIEPIPKDRDNAAQHFKFRGIDDVYNALHPILAKHGVFTTSQIVNRAYSESQSKSGTTMAERVLSIRWRFYATDGSFVETETDGEAMDSGDKASNKAMAAAHKYALMQIFCIPTADEKDTDAVTPARGTASAPRTAAPAKPAPTKTPPASREPGDESEACPTCGGFTDIRVSTSASNPGRAYVRCGRCLDRNGKPGAFLRWADSKPRTQPAPISSEPAPNTGVAAGEEGYIE